MGVLNLWVAYTFSTSVWATFKVFGLTGLMLVFMVAQGFYISRYLKDEETAARCCAERAGVAGRPATRGERLGRRHRGGAARRARPGGARGRRRQPPACRPCRRARGAPFQRRDHQRPLPRPHAASPAIGSYMMLCTT